MPWPVESLLREQVARVRLLEVGYREYRDQVRPVMDEAEMLTGDKNIVVCPMNVQYTIDSLHAYLFNTRNPDVLIRDAAQAALRQVIGRHAIDDALSERKDEIAVEVEEKMNEILNGTYRVGLSIRQVQLRDVRVPNQVVEAFRDVTSAKEDSARSLEQAQGYRNRIMPRAQADSIRMTRAAEGYAQQRVALAQGDSARFVQVYDQYRRAPEVTEARMYMETMERVIGRHPTFLVEGDGGNLVNFLPGGDSMMRNLQGRPPMKSRSFMTTAAIAVVALVLIGSSVYTVDEREQVVITRLGRIVKSVRQAGLHFKTPFLDNVNRFSKQMLESDPTTESAIYTADKKILLVDNYAVWQIVNPELYLQAFPGGEYYAERRLGEVIFSALRQELGRHTQDEVVVHNREAIMDSVTYRSNEMMAPTGVRVVDVRIKRADLPPENARSVYGRMVAERQREATRYRSNGEREATRIMAEADRGRADHARTRSGTCDGAAWMGRRPSGENLRPGVHPRPQVLRVLPQPGIVRGGAGQPDHHRALRQKRVSQVLLPGQAGEVGEASP